MNQKNEVEQSKIAKIGMHKKHKLQFLNGDVRELIFETKILEAKVS